MGTQNQLKYVVEGKLNHFSAREDLGSLGFGKSWEEGRFGKTWEVGKRLDLRFQLP